MGDSEEQQPQGSSDGNIQEEQVPREEGNQDPGTLGKDAGLLAMPPADPDATGPESAEGAASVEQPAVEPEPQEAAVPGSAAGTPPSEFGQYKAGYCTSRQAVELVKVLIESQGEKMSAKLFPLCLDCPTDQGQALADTISSEHCRINST